MVRAYMTVEASLIMPMIMLIYVFIIYMAFFQYDRCILSQDTYILAMRTSGQSDESKEQAFAKQYKEKYIAFRWEKEEYKQTGSQVKIKQAGTVQAPILQKVFALSQPWKMEVERTSTKLSPQTIIWRYRLTKEKLKGEK